MVTELMNGYVKHETHKHITTIEFFHPQSNSLPGKMLQQLAHIIHSAGLDDDTKVIVLKSSGEKAFCGGAFFDELLAIEDEHTGRQFFSGFAHVINVMRKCPKFIIGRVHGKCVGGGLGIAAACDYVIAVEAAEVRLSELSLGIGPFVVGPALERKIGLSAFSQLAIDATTWRNSEWARRKGLYAELHHTVEGMDESIQRLAHSLSHSNPLAMADMKKMFWKGTEHWDTLMAERAAISGKLILGKHAKDAIAEFKAAKKNQE